MKIANTQPNWLLPNCPKPTRSAVIRESSVPSAAILFGKRKPAASNDKAAPQDPKLTAEIERLTQRAPKIFGKPFVSKDMKPLLQKRALYNLNADTAALTEYLPYRQLLVQKNNVASLKQYDALAETLMNKAEFYEVEKSGPAKKAVNNFYQIQDSVLDDLGSHGHNTSWKLIKFLLSIPFNLKNRNLFFQVLVKQAAHSAESISDPEFENKLKKAGIKPLQDASTQYLIAGGIADLFFKNPEQAKLILDNPKHPLRFVVSKEQAWMSGGQTKTGFNLIFANEDALWDHANKGVTSKGTKGTCISQHEFVHALSDPVGGEVLPSMSEDQKNRFVTARTELQTLYSKKDAGLFGLIRHLWNGHAATGLGRYAFFNNLEFLAVSTDTFKAKPQELCRTQPGQEIYQIYKDIFKIDPLKDLKDSQRHNIDA